jgi:hypothetical protein
MTRCKACGAEFRKGVLAFLLTGKGLEGARVCQSCARGGVLLVAPKLAPIVKQKTVRSDGVERALRMLRTYASVAKASAKENELSDGNRKLLSGRAEGIETAIETIKRECGE